MPCVDRCLSHLDIGAPLTRDPAELLAMHALLSADPSIGK